MRVVQIGPYKLLLRSFGLPTLASPRILPQQLPRTFPRHLLKLLHLFVPPLLALKNLLHGVLGPLAHGVLLLADVDDLVSELECFCDYLSQGVFVELSLFCKFEVVVGNSLLEYSRDLLEDLAEVFLELGCQGVEKLLNFVFDLSAVDLFKVALDLAVDAVDHLLQLLDTPLQLLELHHNLLQLNINQVFHELLLHFLHGLLARLDSHGGVHSGSFDLRVCLGLWLFKVSCFLGVDNLIHFFLPED